ncbi:hypothetical protein BH11MYX3_BH11MYX3_19120 [soil metagenome]
MIDPGGEQLGSSARALLDAARDGLAPDAGAVRRVREKVGASVGAGVATGIAMKLGLFGVVAALVIGAGLYANRDRAAETPAIDLPSARSETAPVVVRPAASTESPMIEMAPQSASRSRPVVHTEAAGGIDLSREVELIDLAMGALRRGDAKAALASIHTHAVETHGNGQLAEDAAAIEVEALCRLHDPSVGAHLDAFDAQFPRSAQRSRLTTVCQ